MKNILLLASLLMGWATAALASISHGYSLQKTLDTLHYSPSICPGEIVFVNGHFYSLSNPTGIEILPGQSWNGTDSVIVVDILAAPPVETQIVEVFCDNQIVLVNNHIYGPTNPTGQEIIAQGAANGCDSIITINLTFLTAPITYLTQTICRGDTIWVGTTPYHANYFIGTELLEGASWQGCDSTVEVQLTVLEIPRDTFVLTLCPGETYTLNGIVYDAANPDGTALLPAAAASGCDSMVTIHLDYKPIELYFSSRAPACAEVANGAIRLDSLSGGSFPVAIGFSPDSLEMVTSLPFSLDILAAGHYVLYTQTEGCIMTSTVTVEQAVPPLSDWLGPDRSVFLGDTVCIDGSVSLPFDSAFWSLAAPCSDSACLAGCFQALSDQTFQLNLVAADGCIFRDTVTVFVTKNVRLYLPNAFSPGANPPNDRFFIQTDGSVAHVNYLQIYDRWGALVFSAENLPTLPYEQGWDGTANGKLLNPGIYLYILEVTLLDGTVEKRQGDVALLR